MAIHKKSSGITSAKRVGGETTIKKVTARDSSKAAKKRKFSSSNSVRKNLLDDAVDSESQNNDGARWDASVPQTSLFESGNKSKILANFEEWIKLATDNKINVKNSWNFALIDYFYDLNVLKENNGNINFQKASATLDGCVKIYSSRIDSVANETGKLLSGLVTSNESNSSMRSHGQDVSQSEDIVIDEVTGLPVSRAADDETASMNPSRRRVNNRVLETTLTSFDNLRLATFDEEFIIDPLFKKALSDFDEAGARNLLLSILHIQSDARVVFDTSGETNVNVVEVVQLEGTEEASDKDIDMNEDKRETSSKDDIKEEEESRPIQTLLPPLDLQFNSTSDAQEEASLNYMADALLNLGCSLGLDNLSDDKELCPSIQLVRDSVADISKARHLLDKVVQDSTGAVNTEGLPQDLDLKNTAEPLDTYGFDGNNQNEFELDLQSPMDQQIAEDIFINGDVDERSNFEEQNENLDKETNSSEVSEEDIFDLDFEKNLFTQFQGILNNKSWTGKDHWKVRNIKKRVNPGTAFSEEGSGENKVVPQQKIDKVLPQKNRKKKSRPHVDFSSWKPVNEMMLLNSKSPKINGVRRIDIPVRNRKDPYYNLLPTDYHVTLDKMTVLFTRPLQKGNFFRKKLPALNYRSALPSQDQNNSAESHHEGQEEYWANVYENQDAAEENAEDNAANEAAELNNFASVDEDLKAGLGLDFNDALGNDEGMGYESAVKGNSENALELNAGLLLSNAEESEKANTLKAMLAFTASQKVNYSRVSKKVDIKKLKDNLWRCIESQLTGLKTEEKVLMFTDVLFQLKTLYTFETLQDLSTSFCFICLLHLANEHGFRIDKEEPGLSNLRLLF